MLELYSTQDLILELSNRTTFAGVIIYSKDANLKEDQVHSDFQIASPLENECVKVLLEKIIKELT